MTRRAIVWIGVGGFCLTVLSVGVNTCVRPWGVGPRVNLDTIRALTPGMSREEVEAILGPPLRERPWGTSVILDYALANPFAFWSPELWILFDDNRHLVLVHGERVSVFGGERLVYQTHVSVPPHGQLPPYEAEDFQATFGPCRGLAGLWPA